MRYFLTYSEWDRQRKVETVQDNPQQCTKTLKYEDSGEVFTVIVNYLKPVLALWKDANIRGAAKRRTDERLHAIKADVLRHIGLYEQYDIAWHHKIR